MSNPRSELPLNTSLDSNSKPASSQSSSPLLEVDRLLFQTKELPSKLKNKIQPLVEQHFHQLREDKENSFSDCEIKIYAHRRVQQYLLVEICSRIFDTLDEIIAKHNISVPLNISVRTVKDQNDVQKIQTALLNFKQRYGRDYQRILNLTRDVSNKLIDFEKNENTTMPVEAIYLWQALMHGEEHLNEYNSLIGEILAPLKGSNKSTAQEHTSFITTLFQKLYDFKKELKQLDLINLYAQRLKQHIDDKNNRQLNFSHCWSSNHILDPLSITGFAQACKDYRNQFARVTLLQTLKKSSAFDTYQNLTKLLALEEAPKLSSIINDASPEIADLILLWANEAIHNMTHKIIIWNKVYAPNGQIYLLATNNNPLNIKEGYDIEDNLVGFTKLIEAELRLRETFNLAKMMLSQIKGSMATSFEVTPEDFSLSFKASQGIKPTQEEINARDRRRLKEIEKEKRETRKQEEYRLSQLAFTEKLALENKQNLQAKKIGLKEKLMKHISELSSNKQKLLIDLLDRNNTAHQKYDEKPIIALLSELQLSKETTQGFLIAKELDPNDQSSATAPSTHREHTDGKLDANFIKSLRMYFSDIGITAESLESTLETAKISL